MNIEIRRAVDPDYWNLYVNGSLAVSYESHSVCESIASVLRNRDNDQTLYSEAAEVADSIRDYYRQEIE